HDTTETNGYIRVHCHLDHFWMVAFCEVFNRVIEEIAPSDFEWTVVCTVPCTNTTVVSHLIETIFAVSGRGNGTNLLTWRQLALHTRNGLMDNLRAAIYITTEVAVCSDPVHFPSTTNFPFANYRDIVLCLTGDCTNTTTDT